MTASPLRDRAAAAANGQSTGTAVATVLPGEPRDTVVAVVAQMIPEIARALPRGLDPDRMARLALTAVRNTPKLQNCTPQSFVGSLLVASSMGLEVNTPAGEAYLIPYGNECQLVVGYQGLAKLFWQSPLAKHLDAQAVYANDDFDYAYGLEPFLRHKPAKGERGDLLCFYAVVTLKTGGSHFVVLSPGEVKDLRQGKVGPSGDIKDPMRWMERKTTLKQALKTMPRSAIVNMALAADEEVGTTLYSVHREEAQDITAVAGPMVELEASDADDPAEPEGTFPAPTGDGPKLTKPMQKKIMAQFAEMNIDTHDGRVQYAGDVIGRPVESTNDLTMDEASQVIEAQNRDKEWSAGDPTDKDI